MNRILTVLSFGFAALLACASAEACELADFPIRPDVTAAELLGLPGLDAFLRLLDIPETARRALRSPAPAERRMELPASPPAPLDGELSAGAAAVRLDFPESLRGLPLGGTAGRLHPIPEPEFDPHHVAHVLRASRGQRDPVRAKAIVLEASGRRVAWLSVDAVAVTEDVAAAVQDRLRASGTPIDLLLVSATHAHSGPGAFQRSRFLWIATDLPHEGVTTFVVDRLTAAVREAAGRLVPARVGWGSFPVEGLVVNRRGHGGPVATRFDILRVSDARDRPMAALVLGPIHGTLLDERNLLLSADVGGVIERRLEGLLGPSAVAMHVQGAEGDQAPARREGESEEAALERIGSEIARRANDAYRTTQAQTTAGIDWACGQWTPPAAVFRPGLMVSWVPRFVQLPIAGLIDGRGPLVAVRLAGRALAAVPCEPILDVGEQIADAGRDHGLGPALVAGLTGGYMGYVTTPEEYERGGYEAMATLYGPRTSASLVEQVTAQLERLASRRR
ncbi:MAG: neutral/alkaline non-lysosomal ceramidase N-terminal domain-containing protein [Candidatus Wallbacteria bacterium]|nr:neutral/alkaline non-lysosomal ceramidase N-terminal domain-containing protein [Candidatus Wallbacteria bacterium]